jgi:hypothetical protein
MNWQLMQTALEGVFSEAINIPFVWDDEPRAMIPRPFGLLSLGQSITIGRDASGYTFRDSDITLDIYGHREVTVTVQVFSRQARGEKSSRALIERARLALANPIYRDELRSVGLVFVENHPIADLNAIFQNRKESRAAFDVVFRVLLHESQPLKHMTHFDAVQLIGQVNHEPR